MALIACKNCGKQLSDKATACPHCGAPQTPAPTAPQQPANNGKKIIIGICVAVAVLLMIAFGCMISGNRPVGLAADDTDVPSGSFDDDLYTDEPAWTSSPTPAEFEANMPAAPCLVVLNVTCKKNPWANKYDVDILIDGEKIATLEHGEAGAYPETLEKGSHDVEFRINGKAIGGNDIYDPDDPDTFYTSSFTVSESGEISYLVKLALGNSIEVELV